MADTNDRRASRARETETSLPQLFEDRAVRSELSRRVSRRMVAHFLPPNRRMALRDGRSSFFGRRTGSGGEDIFLVEEEPHDGVTLPMPMAIATAAEGVGRVMDTLRGRVPRLSSDPGRIPASQRTQPNRLTAEQIDAETAGMMEYMRNTLPEVEEMERHGPEGELALMDPSHNPLENRPVAVPVSFTRPKRKSSSGSNADKNQEKTELRKSVRGRRSTVASINTKEKKKSISPSKQGRKVSVVSARSSSQERRKSKSSQSQKRKSKGRTKSIIRAGESKASKTSEQIASAPETPTVKFKEGDSLVQVAEVPASGTPENGPVGQTLLSDSASGIINDLLSRMPRFSHQNLDIAPRFNRSQDRLQGTQERAPEHVNFMQQIKPQSQMLKPIAVPVSYIRADLQDSSTAASDIETEDESKGPVLRSLTYEGFPALRGSPGDYRDMSGEEEPTTATPAPVAMDLLAAPPPSSDTDSERPASAPALPPPAAGRSQLAARAAGRSQRVPRFVDGPITHPPNLGIPQDRRGESGLFEDETSQPPVQRAPTLPPSDGIRHRIKIREQGKKLPSSRGPDTAMSNQDFLGTQRSDKSFREEDLNQRPVDFTYDEDRDHPDVARGNLARREDSASLRPVSRETSNQIRVSLMSGRNMNLPLSLGLNEDLDFEANIQSVSYRPGSAVGSVPGRRDTRPQTQPERSTPGPATFSTLSGTEMSQGQLQEISYVPQNQERRKRSGESDVNIPAVVPTSMSSEWMEPRSRAPSVRTTTPGAVASTMSGTLLDSPTGTQASGLDAPLGIQTRTGLPTRSRFVASSAAGPRNVSLRQEPGRDRWSGNMTQAYPTPFRTQFVTPTGAPLPAVSERQEPGLDSRFGTMANMSGSPPRSQFVTSAVAYNRGVPQGQEPGLDSRFGTMAYMPGSPPRSQFVTSAGAYNRGVPQGQEPGLDSRFGTMAYMSGSPSRSQFMTSAVAYNRGVPQGQERDFDSRFGNIPYPSESPSRSQLFASPGAAYRGVPETQEPNLDSRFEASRASGSPPRSQFVASMITSEDITASRFSPTLQFPSATGSRMTGHSDRSATNNEVEQYLADLEGSFREAYSDSQSEKREESIGEEFKKRKQMEKAPSYLQNPEATDATLPSFPLTRDMSEEIMETAASWKARPFSAPVEKPPGPQLPKLVRPHRGMRQEFAPWTPTVPEMMENSRRPSRVGSVADKRRRRPTTPSTHVYRPWYPPQTPPLELDGERPVTPKESQREKQPKTSTSRELPQRLSIVEATRPRTPSQRSTMSR